MWKNWENIWRLIRKLFLEYVYSISNSPLFLTRNRFSKACSILIRYTKLRICIIIFAPFILKTVFNSHLYGTLSLVMMSNDSYKMLNKCVFCTYGMCACVSVQKFAHHAFLWMDKPPIPPFLNSALQQIQHNHHWILHVCLMGRSQMSLQTLYERFLNHCGCTKSVFVRCS